MNTTSSSSSERGWYLIYTKPKAEKTALENLQRQGFNAYLPQVKSQKRRQRKYTEVIEPLFPRYLFIQLNCTTDNWSPIRSTLGVSSIVRFGAYPMQVPESLILMLQSNENEEGVCHASVPEIKTGDEVEIIDGAMAGYKGIFQSETSKERVIILLDIAGHHTRVSISRHDLQIA